jgi:hypothetical protein
MKKIDGSLIVVVVVTNERNSTIKLDVAIVRHTHTLLKK